jgi:3-dehydroquinate synthase
MADRINVCRDGKDIYDIVLAQSFEGLKEAVSRLPVKEHKICIVTDSNVAPLYLEEVRSILSGCCKAVTVFTFPAGEENKHLDTVRNLYEHLILEHFDRKDMLAALGGGVVGDLCGFGAATYLRGIDFIQIPTTLLSQVDSSIGGKTGVDFDAYKNMVGAFHMPKLVYANLSTLLTLPEEQFSSGMGEVVKHGLIKNREYYQWLKENRQGIAARNLDLCQAMVYGSCMIKKHVVEQDPTEQGERALLNFGHTLEKLENFTMHHGHCVGLGCIAAARISQLRGMITAEEAEDIRNTFLSFGIPAAAPGLAWEQVLMTTRSDKKMDAGVIRFVLLKSIGQAYVDKTVTADEMKAGFDVIGGQA